jgi:hypothetical protein
MGKSTLLRFLAVRLARHALNGDDGALIPVFIPLHDLATSSKPFVEYVVELFVGESPAPGLQDKVSDALREGRCWVFLDGLDEVDTDTQHNLLASIQRLTDHYRHSRFLITTRPGHYFSQLEQFTEYELAPFDGNQLRDFATRWFGPDSRSAEMFLGALARDSRMIEIASTPLLLTLLCLEYQQSATIPADRAAFYDHSVDILLRTWDASRGLRRARLPDLTVARLRKLYSSLAAHFFCAARLTFERADLEQTLSEVLRDELGLQGTFDAAELLPMLEMQHGILIKKWRSVYGFSHLTFQEYFVAAAVVASPEGTDHGFASVVSEHLSEVRWREVIVLAAQLLRRNGDPISALTAAIDRLKTSEVHRSLTRVRMLLEHCSIIPSLAHKFVALGLAVYDFSLTDEVYYDKGFAAAPYKAAFGLDWSEVPTEDYRESYRLLKDTVRRLGEESPDLVNAPIAIWQGYSEDEEWGNGPNLRETVMRANFDPAVVSSFEGRFSPGAYEEIRRFIYAANVLVECMGSRNVEAAGYAIFG